MLPNAATALFRIYQEVVTNVARHSHASRVDACLTATAKICTSSIRDNGDGFDVNSTKGKNTGAPLVSRNAAFDWRNLRNKQ